MQKKNLLLLICVLFSILYVDAKTDFKKIDDLYYNLDVTSMKAYVAPPNKSQYDFTKQNGVIKIPSTVVHKKKVYNVVSIGNKSFKDCKTLKSIDIPNSVTSIGSQAFSGCSGLTSIEIPNSVTYIGDGAYKDCPIETLSIDCQNITSVS